MMMTSTLQKEKCSVCGGNINIGHVICVCEKCDSIFHSKQIVFLMTTVIGLIVHTIVVIVVMNHSMYHFQQSLPGRTVTGSMTKNLLILMILHNRYPLFYKSVTPMRLKLSTNSSVA